VIPKFNENGYLPEGIHDATFAEFQQRFVWNGKRLQLLDGLRQVVRQLWDAGVEEIYIAGSFITAAPLPNDVDGYWVYRKGIDLSKIDPVILNMNIHVLDPISGRYVRMIKLKYGCEFFMHSRNAIPKGITCAEFFAFSRDGVPRGTIRLKKDQ
jgi:hypothetical protein